MQETGTRLEQAQEEKEIATIFLKKIRSYEEGKRKGVDLQIDNIPKLREKWDKMYEWIIVLREYIEEMVCWDVRALRTDRMKIVIQEATGLGERKGTENLAIKTQGSGEDYAKRVLEFLEIAREEKRRKEKEENEKTKWIVSAGVFSPAKEKEETEKSKGREEGELIELYPQGGLMVIHSEKFSDKVPGTNMEKIFPSPSEMFKDILEKIAPILKNMDAETFKQRSDERDRTNKKKR